MGGILCFGPNILLKCINWTFGNNRRQLLLDFEALVKHPDVPSVSCQNFVHTLFVDWICSMWFYLEMVLHEPNHKNLSLPTMYAETAHSI